MSEEEINWNHNHTCKIKSERDVDVETSCRLPKRLKSLQTLVIWLVMFVIVKSENVLSRNREILEVSIYQRVGRSVILGPITLCKLYNLLKKKFMYIFSRIYSSFVFY